MSTQLDLSTQSGVGPFDLTGLNLLPNNRIPWVAQIDVYQNDSLISSSNYTIDPTLGTITFDSDINDLNTLIRRDTPAELAVYFIDGARVPAADLNDAFGQLANKVDELRTDPVADLDLNDLTDVGATGDNPTTDDILVYDGTKWAYENRGAANSVTAENVLVEFNGSDAETTLQNHDIDIDALQEQTADISVVGDLTKVDGDFRVTGDAFLDGAVSFGSLVGDLDLNGTFTTDSVDINTTNGATAISISNTGSGETANEFTIDMASTARTSFRNSVAQGFEFMSEGSIPHMYLNANHTVYWYPDDTTLDYFYMNPGAAGTSSLAFGVYDNQVAQVYMTGNGRIIKKGSHNSDFDVLNRDEMDARYVVKPPATYIGQAGAVPGDVWGIYTVEQDFGNAAVGHMRAVSVSDVQEQLDGRSDVYYFTAVVNYKTSLSGTQPLEWRSGIATGDSIYSYVNSMRSGKSYQASLTTVDRYNLNIDYQRIWDQP